MTRKGIGVRLPRHGDHVAQVPQFANVCRAVCRSLRLAPCTGTLTAPDILLTMATPRRIFGMPCQGADLGPERDLLQGPAK